MTMSWKGILPMPSLWRYKGRNIWNAANSTFEEDMRGQYLVCRPLQILHTEYREKEANASISDELQR